MTLVQLESAARSLLTEIVASSDYAKQFPGLSEADKQAHVERAVNALTVGDLEELGLL